MKTRTYLEWEKAARAAVAPFEPLGMVRGPYVICLSVKRPDRRIRDLSNTIKTTEDFLVSLGVVEDDSLAQKINLAWREWGEPGVEIEIASCGKTPRETSSSPVGGMDEIVRAGFFFINGEKYLVCKTAT